MRRTPQTVSFPNPLEMVPVEPLLVMYPGLTLDTHTVS